MQDGKIIEVGKHVELMAMRGMCFSMVPFHSDSQLIVQVQQQAISVPAA
jgi:hypothetical protein